MYYDEIEFYFNRIKAERANDRLTELAIIQNPSTKDPKILHTHFKKILEEVDGKDYLHKTEMTDQDERKLKELARRMKRNAAERRNG